jgi:FixJ family two-component response regulator
MSDNSIIFIVDDDPAVRDALTSLFEAANYAVEAYPDADAFLAANAPQRPGCLVLDMQMPGMGGLGLQAVLAERKDSRPIIFLTAHGTVPMTVRAFRNGAFDFLEKPAEGGTLLALVRNALQQGAEGRRETAQRDLARLRCATLTQREREILQLVAAGNRNKDIGQHLGISHRTVELHRMRIMQKTSAQNVIELASIAQAAGLSLKPPRGEDASTPETS